jgi:hypothetical protein
VGLTANANYLLQKTIYVAYYSDKACGVMVM